MATGSCRACGHAPVACDARECRVCGKREPNPGVVNRTIGPAMLYGLFAGAAVGSVLGFVSDGPGMAIGGALLGAIPGLFCGVLFGLILAVTRRAMWGNSGARRERTNLIVESCKKYPYHAAKRHV